MLPSLPSIDSVLFKCSPIGSIIQMHFSHYVSCRFKQPRSGFNFKPPYSTSTVLNFRYFPSKWRTDNEGFTCIFDIDIFPICPVPSGRCRVWISTTSYPFELLSMFFFLLTSSTSCSEIHLHKLVWLLTSFYLISFFFFKSVSSNARQ